MYSTYINVVKGSNIDLKYHTKAHTAEKLGCIYTLYFRKHLSIYLKKSEYTFTQPKPSINFK